MNAKLDWCWARQSSTPLSSLVGLSTGGRLAYEVKVGDEMRWKKRQRASKVCVLCRHAGFLAFRRKSLIGVSDAADEKQKKNIWLLHFRHRQSSDLVEPRPRVPLAFFLLSSPFSAIKIPQDPLLDASYPSPQVPSPQQTRIRRGSGNTSASMR